MSWNASRDIHGRDYIVDNSSHVDDHSSHVDDHSLNIAKSIVKGDANTTDNSTNITINNHYHHKSNFIGRKRNRNSNENQTDSMMPMIPMIPTIPLINYNEMLCNVDDVNIINESPILKSNRNYLSQKRNTNQNNESIPFAFNYQPFPIHNINYNPIQPPNKRRKISKELPHNMASFDTTNIPSLPPIITQNEQCTPQSQKTTPKPLKKGRIIKKRNNNNPKGNNRHKNDNDKWNRIIDSKLTLSLTAKNDLTTKLKNNTVMIKAHEEEDKTKKPRTDGTTKSKFYCSVLVTKYSNSKYKCLCDKDPFEGQGCVGKLNICVKGHLRVWCKLNKRAVN